jgi:hypothetical protein
MQAKVMSPTEGQGKTQPAPRAIKFDAAGLFLFQMDFKGPRKFLLDNFQLTK